MNQFTTKDFIENLKFSYFETYSFQRKGDFDVYKSLFTKFGIDRESLSPEEKILFGKLRTSNLYNQENSLIFTEDGVLNKTAELVSTSKGFRELNDQLTEILKIPFFGYDAWMCWPIYRDAILFFDSDNNLIDGINICFQCSDVINLSKKQILTDRAVYVRLEVFLQSLGHKIN